MTNLWAGWADHNWPEHKWSRSKYQGLKIGQFEIIDAHLPTPPKQILDIGCGLAFESELFQKKYGTELYLLDGDAQVNKPHQTRRHKYGGVEDMKFLTGAKRLKQSYDQRGMRYHFINAAAPSIPDDVTFDLVCSTMSCGFHYPVAAYADLIKEHTDENSRLIFDIRNNLKRHDVQRSFDVIAVLMTSGNKFRKCEIKLK